MNERAHRDEMDVPPRIPRAALLGACAIAVSLAGCDGANADERRVIALADLPGQRLDEERCVWQSVPWSGTEWLSYPGRVTLDMEHPLGICGGEPADVTVYLSFDRQGRFAAQGAGDPVVVESVSASRVVLRNNTNQDYFVRVVVR